MRWVVGMHDKEARRVFHLGGLDGCRDTGGGGPEESGGGAVLFDLRPEVGFE